MDRNKWCLCLGYLVIRSLILVQMALFNDIYFKRYGWTLSISDDPINKPAEYTVGKILLVFFSIIIAVFSLGNAAQYANTLTTARAAAFEVFKIIDRVNNLK